jgi:hypothetical protein
MPPKKSQTKQKTKPDSVYYKEFKTDWGNLKKIGVSNAVPIRLNQLQESGILRDGKVIYEAVVNDAYKLESALHRKYKQKQFIPPKKTDGMYELFKDLTPNDDAAIIQEIQQASSRTCTRSVSSDYTDDYEPANRFKVFLCFMLPIVIFLLNLYFKK